MKESIPVKISEIYTIKIERLADSADGVGRVDGFTVFVPYTLPAETVRAKIEIVKKNYARARLIEIIEPSPSRTISCCPLYDKCGGCQLQHLDYAGQLAMKRRQVIDALTHIGGFRDIFVEPTLGAAEPWYYRNKVQFPIGREQGKIQIGCYERGTHHVIDTPHCYIQKETNNIIVAAMKEAIDRFRIPPYDEDRRTGVLRHVMGRVGKDGEAMAVLITATEKLDKAKAIVNFLREKIPRLVSVQQNIQTYHNNVILGRETKTLWGRDSITDTIGAYSYRISARSFFQVNTAQAAALYEKVREFAALTGKETVIDAYCGTGTISLYLAPNARRVYGVEIVSPAIADAKKNAAANKIRNAEFLVGDAAAIMPKLCHRLGGAKKIGGAAPDVIVLDPPRAGCDEKVLQTIIKLNPPKIIYVSCNPATLARDLAILVPDGYRIEKVQPVDMFPQTIHTETVCLLTRENDRDNTKL